MRPAFSSTKQAAAFALVLLILLLLPVIIGKRMLPPREEIYSSIWWPSGDFPYMEQQIFHEKSDIDILFIGSSHIWAAFDTPYIQEQLSRQLGRQAVVRTFGWGGAGEDELYFVMQDLLKHRKVRMLVFDDVYNDLDVPHPLAIYNFRFGDDADALAELPLSLKTPFYFAAIVGMPRNLLSLMRSNFPADLNSDKKTYWEIRSHALNPVARLGTITARIGFRVDPLADPNPFVIYAPKTGIRASDVCIYSSATRTNFDFSNETIPPMQLNFLQKFAALAQEHGCKLVMAHIPTFDERRASAVRESAFWPNLIHSQFTMIGIPPATLYGGLADDDVRRLYSDHVHFNQNGQTYFTSLMTPPLLQIYDSQIEP